MESEILRSVLVAKILCDELTDPTRATSLDHASLCLTIDPALDHHTESLLSLLAVVLGVDEAL